MRLSLDSIAVLDAIDRHGSFAAAAEAMHRVPSAITYAIQKLEEDLGVQLFDRSGHRAQLTAAGRELLHEGRRLLTAAGELESRVKRVATGYEVELRIAVDSLIPMPQLFPLLTAFYAESYGTRLRLLTEVYGGMWDALVDNRADLAIGAPGEGPAGGGFSTRPLGVIEFIFLVAPTHPLAALPGPLKNADLVKHRVVSAADSSRSLPPRTSGLISGQDVLTVPGIQSKIEAQRAALGVGYLPRHLARAEIEAGRLIPKTVEEPKPAMPVYLAWRTAHRGKALRWFLDHLDDAAVRDSLMN